VLQLGDFAPGLLGDGGEGDKVLESAAFVRHFIFVPSFCEFSDKEINNL
jgi:hypothetical protein